jgi:hypothetical protein
LHDVGQTEKAEPLESHDTDTSDDFTLTVDRSNSPSPLLTQEGVSDLSRQWIIFPQSKIDNRISTVLLFKSFLIPGAVAQLGERLNGIQEADGSIPFSSTISFSDSCLLMPYFVYVLESESTGSSYTGHTSNLEKRLLEHSNGKSLSTRV